MCTIKWRKYSAMQCLIMIIWYYKQITSCFRQLYWLEIVSKTRYYEIRETLSVYWTPVQCGGLRRQESRTWISDPESSTLMSGTVREAARAVRAMAAELVRRTRWGDEVGLHHFSLRSLCHCVSLILDSSLDFNTNWNYLYNTKCFLGTLYLCTLCNPDPFSVILDSLEK